MNPTRFDEIVATLYEAASGRQPWRSVLDALASGFDASACVLMGIDTSERRAVFRWDGGRLANPRSGPELAAGLASDPVVARLLSSGPGQWLRAADAPPDEADAPRARALFTTGNSRFAAGARILEDEGEAIVFLLCRGARQRPVDDDEAALLRRIGWHLGRGLRIYRERTPSAIDTASGAELVRSTRHPLLLVDDQRRIHYRNAEADALLRGAGTLRERHGRLACCEPADDAQLLDALTRLELSGPHPPGGPPERTIVRLGSGGPDPTVVFATAVRHPATCDAFGRTALANLLFHRPGSAMRPDPTLIAEAFELTPAEARVAAWLARGLSADQIAAERGVSTQTIRAQIRAVFEKTGINRQADLIRLLVEMPGSGGDVGDDEDRLEPSPSG